MRKLKNLLGLSICCFIMFCQPIYAANKYTYATNKSCDQVIISANDTWLPFVEKKRKGHMAGFIVELVEIMLHELDLPYRYSKSFHGHDMSKIGLSFNNLDMVLMNKKPNAQYDYLEFVKPSYAEDATVVAVNSPQLNSIEDWHQLMGLVGLNSEHYFFNTHLQDIKDNYLFVQKVPNIDVALDALRLGDVNYVIDSRTRILAKSQSKSLGDVFILPDSHYQESLYLAINKQSPCSAYIPFFKKRLMELKEQGILTEMLLARYYPDIHVLSAEDAIEYK